MKLVYQPIFDIQIWHDYYLGQPDLPRSLSADYDISNVLALVPTKDCIKTLKNLRFTPRFRSWGMTIFGESEAVSPGDSATDYRTKIAVDRPDRLTFWLRVNEPNFANFTNLPFASFGDRIFYFSNRSGNAKTYSFQTEAGATETADYLFLSRPLPAYAPGNEYELGQLVTRDNRTWEAVRYPVADVFEAEDWQSFAPSEYVSGGDRLTLQNPRRSHTISTANPGDTFRFTLTDVNQTIAFSEAFTVPESHPAGDAISLNLNFINPSPGRYQLSLDGSAIDEFILSDSAGVPNGFALVEIVLNPAIASDSFAPLIADNGETLIQPRRYVIRFKNRSTRWRYHTQSEHELTAEDLQPMGLELLDSQTYATSRHLGLRQQPNPPPPNNSRRNLPFPGAARIKPEINSDRRVTQVFSDIYL